MSKSAEKIFSSTKPFKNSTQKIILWIKKGRHAVGYLQITNTTSLPMDYYINAS